MYAVAFVYTYMYYMYTRSIDEIRTDSSFTCFFFLILSFAFINKQNIVTNYLSKLSNPNFGTYARINIFLKAKNKFIKKKNASE